MFSFRKPSRTHSQLLMDELAESGNHLKLAAAYAAGGAAHRLTPAFDRAREVANRGLTTTRDSLAPIYEEMREGAMSARKARHTNRRSRWPVVFGIVAAGAAVGAAGAVMARRRRTAAEWDEFEPMGGVETGYGPDEAGRTTAGKKVTAGAASVAGSVSAQAGKIADSLHSRSGTGTGNIGDKADDRANRATRAGDTTDKAKDPSRNSRP